MDEHEASAKLEKLVGNIDRCLNVKIAIYIPSTVEGNIPASADLISYWVRETKIRMANLFGGFTAYAGQGGWCSAEHGLIEEGILIIQSYTDQAGLARVGELKELARSIAVDMRQEAVAVEVAGTLNFVSA